MPIKFICGKPRGGKTLRSVEYLIHEMLNGNRNIVTNLPLRMGDLQEYLLERGCTDHVWDRIRLLNEDETGEFYRYRGKDSECRDVLLPLNYDPSGKTDKLGRPMLVEQKPLCVEVLNGDKRLERGVVYFIDEVHIYFNARKWANVAEAAIWYASQHGKLGDDVFLITQVPEKVANDFRDLAQEFHYVRNKRKERIGMWKAGNGFTEAIYLEIQKKGTEKGVPMETKTYTLDVNGIASLYDTSAGVGMPGGGNADQGKDAVGLPFWTIPAALVAVVALGFFVADTVPKWWTRKAAEQTVLANPQPERPQTSTFVPMRAPDVIPPRQVEPPKPQTQATPKEQSPVYLTGYLERSDGKKIAVLSDGTTRTPDSHDVKAMTRRSVFFSDGTRTYLQPKKTVQNAQN